MSNVKLCILIPTLKIRSQLLSNLLDILLPQITSRPLQDVKILIEVDNTELTIGAKRNLLTTKAHNLYNPDYIVFVDDDDTLSPDYIEKIMKAIESNPDVIGIVGQQTTNGENPRTFIHSLKYNSWFEKNKIYYRNPNHLNPIKTEIALKVKFPNKSFGEDKDYSMAILPLLKTEVFIPETIYYYDFWQKDRTKCYKEENNNVKFFLKYPSRNRAELMKSVISQFRENSSGKYEFKFVCSFDENDITMNNHNIITWLNQQKDVIYNFGKSKNKIDAVNRDLNLINTILPNWNIQILISDDVTCSKNWDEIIANDMLSISPDFDAGLHYNDQFLAKEKLWTISVLGRKYFEKDNYIYNPNFESLWADNFQMDLCKKRNKYHYFDKNVLQHPWINITGKDELYLKNSSTVQYLKDKNTYQQLIRKINEYI